MTELMSLITIQELARILRYSPKTIYKKAARGEIPSIPISRRKRLFSRDAIVHWLANRQMGDL
jgi:excisionase family DNA binding protein